MNQNKIKSVIFDMDGVLVDTEPLHIRAFQIYMDELGLQYKLEYIHGFVGYSIADNIERINQDFLKGKEVPVEQGERRRDDIYIGLLNSTRLEPLPGVRSLLDFCNQNNIPTALASSSSQEQVKIILDNLKTNGLNLWDTFDSIVHGDLVQKRKPAPDIYLMTVDNLKLRPSECWTIEDSGAGVRSAKAAGLNAIGLLSPFIGSSELKPADKIVQSIEEAELYLRTLNAR